MKLDAYSKIIAVILIWAVGALLMTLVYQKLREMGFIYDNPDFIKTPTGQWEKIYEPTWNSRKVIFGICGLCFFGLMAARVTQIIVSEVNKEEVK